MKNPTKKLNSIIPKLISGFSCIKKNINEKDLKRKEGDNPCEQVFQHSQQ